MRDSTSARTLSPAKAGRLYGKFTPSPVKAVVPPGMSLEEAKKAGKLMVMSRQDRRRLERALQRSVKHGA